ncbi:MAG: response regulator [Proteobacteria bacterium]|nr:response regulator [Pseudomonadota bacterium]
MPDTERPSRLLLVVEDEFLVALDLAGLLEQLGFETVIAVRLDQALDAVARLGPSFGAALLDINLAGVRSWPVARALRSHAVRFAFLTGYEADHADIPNDLRGAPVWAKPIQLGRMRECMQQIAGDLLAAPTPQRGA